MCNRKTSVKKQNFGHIEKKYSKAIRCNTVVLTFATHILVAFIFVCINTSNKTNETNAFHIIKNFNVGVSNFKCTVRVYGLTAPLLNKGLAV